MIWWTFGMAFAIGYHTIVYLTFRGKISSASKPTAISKVAPPKPRTIRIV